MNESIGSALIERIDNSLLASMLAFGSIYYPPTDPYASADYRRWLCLHNPHGEALAVVVRNGDQLIAQAALIPVRLAIGAKDNRLGYFVVDVLTHPDYRKLRLFSRIIECAMSFVTERGALLLGHPNKAALPGWQRAGMDFQPDLRPAAVLPLLSSGRVLSARSDVLAIWPDLQGRMAATATSTPPEIERTVDYARWRYYDRPDKDYKVLVRLDAKGAPLTFSVATPWRHGLHLLVDWWANTHAALAAPFPAIALLPDGSRTVRNAIRMPTSRRIPFFVTDPLTRSHDCRCITLAASDF